VRQRLGPSQNAVDVIAGNGFQIALDRGLKDDLVAVRHRNGLEKVVFPQSFYKFVEGDASLLAAEATPGDGDVVRIFQGFPEGAVH
jgi:hypothetical protein